MSSLVLSLVSGISIGGLAAYLGTLMLQKRMSLVAGPLGHLTLPGVALALLYGFDVSIGAFPFVILGIILIWLLELRTKLPPEALTAIIFASGVAIAFLFLPLKQAEVALVGDITRVNLIDTIVSVIVCFVLFLVIRKIFPQMILINISEDLAKVEGVDIKKYNFLYLLAIGIIVSLGVKLVGSLLTAALVAIPSAAARNLSKNLHSYTLLAPIFGIISAVSGILVYYFTKLPAGPIIILINTLIFVISAILKRKP